MAKKPTPVRARVLVDVPAYGLKCGDVAEGSQASIDALAAAGAVDPHEDAVAYAVGARGAVVSVGYVEPEPESTADEAAAPAEEVSPPAAA
jgi:hypothetical protein